MIFTEELFKQVAPTDNFTKAQMQLFGEPWPQVAGWKKRIIGAEITNEHLEALLTFRKQLENRKSAEFGVRGKTRKEHKKEASRLLTNLEPVILPNLKTEDWNRKTWMKEERKTYLDVPYDEKGEAKILGAKWDFKVKKWYAIGDSTPFYKWV